MNSANSGQAIVETDRWICGRISHLALISLPVM